MTQKTLFDKIWAAHQVVELEGGRDIILIDRMMLHEITGGIALRRLVKDNKPFGLPSEHIFSVADHAISTAQNRGLYDSPSLGGSEVIHSLQNLSEHFGIHYIRPDSRDHGIVHVISPEQGIAQPGLTLICGDSHTCTVGALGTLGWSVGSTEIGYALRAGGLIIKRPQNMRIILSGTLGKYVYSKDIMLHLLRRLGSSGARNYVVEYTGDTVTKMSLDGRMTLCNMTAELGTRYALVAPDEITFNYLKERPLVKHLPWEKTLTRWQQLYSDKDAVFAKEITENVSAILPYVTWGISPMHALPIGEKVPNPEESDQPDQVAAVRRALTYMRLQPNTLLSSIGIDAAFIGSCTNARLSDLRAAAAILKGHKVSAHVDAMCTPGSMQVRQAAEAEGLDTIFKAAGFSWRMPGCSSCAGREGPILKDKRVISSTNRNFENRQGPNTRTHLASPATVAASAITGFITSPNEL